MKLIQIYKSVNAINKHDYNASNRKKIQEWDEFVSNTGFLEAEILFLPQHLKNEPSIINAEFLVIQDIRGFDSSANSKGINDLNLPVWYQDFLQKNFNTKNQQHKFFQSYQSYWDFEIFEFSKLDDDILEVWFKYDEHFGIPKRESHKIAEIQIGQAIRFKSNGKIDFEWTDRKQRTFMEYDFIIQYLGNAKTIEFLPPNRIQKTKKLPLLDNEIDERKILW